MGKEPGQRQRKGGQSERMVSEWKGKETEKGGGEGKGTGGEEATKPGR